MHLPGDALWLTYFSRTLGSVWLGSDFGALTTDVHACCHSTAISLSELGMLSCYSHLRICVRQVDRGRTFANPWPPPPAPPPPQAALTVASTILLCRALFNVAANLTTNELLNRKRCGATPA